MSSQDDDPDMSDPFQRINFFWDYARKNRGEYFDSTVVKFLTLVSASRDAKDPNRGYCTFELTVDRSICNAGDNLHGGAVALIFDICTSMAVVAVSREDFWDQGHVSRNLNCSYLRPAPVGTVLLVECEVVHLGKSMGQLKGQMKRKSDGMVCYICNHDKAQVAFRLGKL